MIHVVREAKRSDLPALCALYERVARATFTWFPPDAIDGADAAEDFEVEAFFLVEGPSGPVGYAALFRAERFLHSLYVDAAARCQGVGSTLLDHVRREAGGPISLKVQKRNLAAIAFYRRRGLDITGEGGALDPGGGWWLMTEVA